MKNHHLLCGLACNPALPPELVDRLVALALAEPVPPDDVVEDLADALAERSDLRRDQVLALAAHSDHAGLRLAYRGTLTAADVDPASRPLTALALLDEGRGRPEWGRVLAADPDFYVPWKLASCPGLPPDVTDALAEDPDVVTELAAWGPSPVAARLALHPDPEVRGAAAANPAIPADILMTLAEDSELSLNWVLAERTDLPQAVYERLSAVPLPGTRAQVARNPATGEELIRLLAADEDPDVRRSLAQHPHIPLDLLTELAVGTRLGPNLLPRIASATPAEAAALAASASAAVRMLVAERRDLPPELRDALADDPDASVVKAVAPHPGLSEERLRAMVARFGVQVLARVAANPDASGALLEELTLHRPPVRKVFKEVARHPNATGPALLACLADKTGRRLAAAHPALPAQAFPELLADEDHRVAQEAAGNPALPPALMAELVP
uniref:Leucine rich repeat variant n=1 Tax=Streptomyces sp. NBC_00049 TaxID=2903617 RepID=A0AAU2JJT2_9ACTN